MKPSRPSNNSFLNIYRRRRCARGGREMGAIKQQIHIGLLFHHPRPYHGGREIRALSQQLRGDMAAFAVAAVVAKWDWQWRCQNINAIYSPIFCRSSPPPLSLCCSKCERHTHPVGRPFSLSLHWRIRRFAFSKIGRNQLVLGFSSRHHQPVCLIFYSVNHLLSGLLRPAGFPGTMHQVWIQQNPAKSWANYSREGGSTQSSLFLSPFANGDRLNLPAPVHCCSATWNLVGTERKWPMGPVQYIPFFSSLHLTTSWAPHNEPNSIFFQIVHNAQVDPSCLDNMHTRPEVIHPTCSIRTDGRGTTKNREGSMRVW